MNEATLSALENLLASTTIPAVARKAQALLLRHEGWGCVDIGEELGLHKDTVSRWCSEFRKEQESQVLEPARVGRPPILNETNTQLFRSLIFLTQSRDRPARGWDIQKELEARGISMSLSTVYSSLHAQGFSYQTARPFNPKRDDVQVQQWKLEFPTVLKTVEENKKKVS